MSQLGFFLVKPKLIWNNFVCISGGVEIYTSPINVELCLRDRVVARTLTPFWHSLEIQLSKRHSADIVLTSYADILLKVHKINEMENFLFRAIIYFLPVGGKQNWNVIDESEGYQSLLPQYNLSIFSTTSYLISEDTDFVFPFTVLVHLPWCAKHMNSAKQHEYGFQLPHTSHSISFTLASASFNRQF